MSWEDLFTMMKAKKIEFAKVNSNARFKELETIPEKIFATLPEMSHDKLQNSKVASGDAFAKFIPGNTILVTPITTRTSLVHEYLHYLQFKSNSDYAKALMEGPKLMPLFLTGKISREKYEETTTVNNALFAMGEYEIYKALAEHKAQISSLEHQNNLELLEFYRKKTRR